jgi:hypothetical protein
MKQPISFRKTSSGLLGALAIASGTSAYASIITVNTPADLTNVPNGANTAVNWDINSDGIMDFTFQNRYPNTAAGSYGVVWQLNMNPFAGTAATNGVDSYLSLIRYAFARPAGALFSAASAWSTTTQVTLGSMYSYGANGFYNYGGFAADGRTAGTTANGAVTPGTFAFAGFRFSAADGTHYGWVKLAVNAGLIDFANPIAAAYESVAGVAINAGAVPEPGTMALLALGAAGALGTAIKRRRAA